MLRARVRCRASLVGRKHVPHEGRRRARVPPAAAFAERCGCYAAAAASPVTSTPTILGKRFPAGHFACAECRGPFPNGDFMKVDVANRNTAGSENVALRRTRRCPRSCSPRRKRLRDPDERRSRRRRVCRRLSRLLRVEPRRAVRVLRRAWSDAGSCGSIPGWTKARQRRTKTPKTPRRHEKRKPARRCASRATRGRGASATLRAVRLECRPRSRRGIREDRASAVGRDRHDRPVRRVSIHRRDSSDEAAKKMLADAAAAERVGARDAPPAASRDVVVRLVDADRLASAARTRHRGPSADGPRGVTRTKVELRGTAPKERWAEIVDGWRLDRRVASETSETNDDERTTKLFPARNVPRRVRSRRPRVPTSPTSPTSASAAHRGRASASPGCPGRPPARRWRTQFGHCYLFARAFLRCR